MSTAMTSPTPAQVAAGRRTLLLATGLLMLPFILGGALYLSGWKPASTGNRGELLQPPPVVKAQLPEAAAGKWVLILVPEANCDALCASRLDALRRIQVSLNKDMARLRRVVMAADPGEPGITQAQAAQPDLLVARRDATWTASPGVYVADPDGHLVLRYGLDTEPKDIRSDLDRLLKYSWTG
ncbi:MAG TPA: hypothetical protein PKK51_13310 [Rhodocyclaceae bacterium]|jgi:hypothetical protein|nr:hypothetical protein [Rhodocyclaceae bacterium]